MHFSVIIVIDMIRKTKRMRDNHPYFQSLIPFESILTSKYTFLLALRSAIPNVDTDEGNKDEIVRSQ